MCRKGIEWLLPCVRVCSRGVGERGVAENGGKRKEEACCSKRVASDVVQCQHVCETSCEDGMGCGTAGVRWKLVYRVDTAAWLGAGGGEGGG